MRAGRGLIGVATAIAISAVAGHSPAAGINGEISAEGPLTGILVSPDLNCQVAHEADVSFEFFGAEAGACGTFLAIGGVLYGPAAIPPVGLIGTPWTPVNQSPVTGSGRDGDPFQLITTADAGDVGVRLQQTDSYQVGEESYRTDVRISNSTDADQRAILYRAGDCFLQDSDTGFGRVDDGAPACVISQASDARIEQWLPLTPGSRYFEGGFSEMWQLIAAQTPFPDTCACDQAVDNGAGLSWEVTVPAGGSVEVSHLTFFSPQGRQPATPLRDSVPGPDGISLDPLVIVSSALIAAGVVAFIPFPATLFNSTLEEHYAEVTATVARVRSRLRHLVRTGIGRIRPARGRLPPSEHQLGAGAAPEAVVVPPSRPAGWGFAVDEGFWRTPLGIVTFVLVSASLYGLLDPTLGIDSGSLATLLGLSLGMCVMLLAFGVPLLVGTRRLHVSVGMRALPATLLIAVACVVVSRVAQFQPGYLYGMIIGFTFSRALTRDAVGRLDAVATTCGLALAVAAWLLLPAVRAGGAADDQPFVAVVLETAFATVVVAGLEAALFAMMPLRFLPGERVRGWSPRAWAALLGVATFGFCHILLNPSSGYLADTTRTSLLTVVLLLAAFGGGSVLFWAYFRFRS